jgi:phosphoribosyl-ATP pyrophosphohydrolase
MQINEYLLHYKAFHDEFTPNAGPKQKLHKLCEEVEEHVNAVNEGIDDLIIDETIDVMNTSIAYLHSVGVVNPLFAGYQKLQITAKKYREKKAC